MSTGTEQYSCTRQLPGPIEKAWKYLTEPDLLETWLGRGALGPKGASYEIVQTEKAPFPMPGKVVGEILEFSPPHRILFTWQHVQDGAEPTPEMDTVVEFKLQETTQGVDFTITHSKLRSQDLELVHPGWMTHTEFFIDQLTGRQPEPFKARFEKYFDGPLPWEAVKERHPDFPGESQA